ncbi:helix-turn-helix domain-containing protein [Halomonas campisalis]|uniref:Helix-turn-helix domain-containing protein n=1 Tax=Billgrantia campisalis TaxID=74661 RepID=A0ABS9PAL7_9GAMM|nr:AraC family transcriptional regulator [Halomonas campisalis]MCG6658834.1 helix-turn-helix domain-containing protein [Halomonas campisalis]MDR5864517.1 AraC family transcriptional regulator ligand-binding domain-containing protein [Halomonas campisalis]
MTVTVSMHFVNELFRGVPAMAAERGDYLKRAGISPFLLEAPHGRVTVEQFATLYRLLVIECDDETPGFFARPLRGGTLKLLCLSLLEAPTLKVALHRYKQFFRILLDDFGYDSSVEGDLARVALVEKRPPAGSRILIHELMLKLFHGIASWMIARKIPPILIDCAYAQPAHSADYRYFYPGRVRFDQAESALYIDAALLEEPVRQTKRHLGDFLQRAPTDWFYVSFEDRLVSHRVREHLARNLASSGSVRDVAVALHMSVRTLSRRLAAEGTHFQAVKDEFRRDYAIQALTRSDRPLLGISEALGFEDLACFSRAFKAWTGNSPAAYRRALGTSRT